MLGKNLKIAALYNLAILIFMLFMELRMQDTTGQGMVGITAYLTLFTLIHWIAIVFSVFKHKAGFGAGVLNVLAVAGFNIVAVVVDIVVIIVALNIFKR